MKYFVPYNCGSTDHFSQSNSTDYLSLVLKFQQLFKSERTIKQFIYKSKHEGINSGLKMLKREVEFNLKDIRNYKNLPLYELEKILSSLECCRSIIIYQRESGDVDDSLLSKPDEQVQSLISIENWIEKISVWYYSLEGSSFREDRIWT